VTVVATSNKSVGLTSGVDNNAKPRGSIRVHTGEALWKFARTYPKLLDMLLENVQNTIDANGTRMYIGVDLKDRTVVVCDNGDGVTEDEYQRALHSVARGKTDKGKIGQFGIGMISPLNKCSTMYFMSRPEGQAHVNSWHFVCEEIRESDNPEAPLTELSNFPPLPPLFALAANELQKATGDTRPTAWRTVIRLEGLIKDTMLTRVSADRLEAAIVKRFNQWIIERGMQIVLKIRDASGKVEQRKVTPKPFLGQKLQTLTIPSQDAGKISFELYRARVRNGKREGIGVMVLDPKGAPITVSEVQAQAAGDEHMHAYYTLAKEGFEVLTSGVFEGLIRVDDIQILQNRRGFEVDQRFKDLCFAIGDWYEQIGSSHMSSEREEATEQDFQDLSQEVMDELLQSFRNNEHLLAYVEELSERLPRLKVEQATRERKAKEEGRATTRKASPTRRIVKPRESNGKQQEKASDYPMLPKFGYDTLEDSLNLWEYDVESGVLTVNLLHEHYVRVYETAGGHTARNKKFVKHLLRYLQLQVMMMLLRHQDLDLDIHRSTIDDHIGLYIETIILAN